MVLPSHRGIRIQCPAPGGIRRNGRDNYRDSHPVRTGVHRQLAFCLPHRSRHVRGREGTGAGLCARVPFYKHYDARRDGPGIFTGE